MIVAMWKVRGQTYQDMMSEAESDANMFGIEETLVPSLVDGYTINVIHCKPNKIQGPRVELWEGWAVITWGNVPLPLLTRAVEEAEWRLALVSREPSSSSLKQLQSP